MLCQSTLASALRLYYTFHNPQCDQVPMEPGIQSETFDFKRNSSCSHPIAMQALAINLTQNL